MKKLKKIWNSIEMLIQIYIPTACFIIMFFVFNMQVILRKGFNSPTVWSTEVSAIMFLWMVMLATNYSTKTHSHVSFSMVYDAVGEKGKKIISILGNALLVVTYSLAFHSCWLSIITDTKVSTALRIPHKYIFMPFMIMMSFTILYSFVDIVCNILSLIYPKKFGKEACK